MLHSLTHPFTSQVDPFSQQVEKLANSEALHGSESLCKLLRYLAKHALEHPGVRLKEYQIATEVFGRPADFDPQADSMIRVQAGRLRTKLSEYYARFGADDLIVVELPKGSYQLKFHRRDSHSHSPQLLAVDHTLRPDISSSRNWKIAVVVLSVLLVSFAILALVLLHRKTSPPVLAETSEAPAEFHLFWKSFVQGPSAPWLIFSNAAFVGRPETGMRYYNAGHDAQGPVWDHYTGVGEVLAVHELDEVFAGLRHQLRVKRGSLFSLDDVRNNDLIFLGSPSENLTLADIPTTHAFVFQRLIDGPRKGDLGIVNVRPKPGEATVFVASPFGSPLTEDYAVVAFMPGLDASRSVMIFAGTTTFGTQGAVEYVCRRDTLKQLLSRLPISNSGEVKPFEALLHIKVTHGVPVSADLVTVRP